MTHCVDASDVDRDRRYRTYCHGVASFWILSPDSKARGKQRYPSSQFQRHPNIRWAAIEMVVLLSQPQVTSVDTRFPRNPTIIVTLPRYVVRLVRGTIEQQRGRP